MNTVEALSNIGTCGDLCIESNKNVNPNNLILHINPGIPYNLRFLGPFIYAERLYVHKESHVFAGTAEIKRIAKGDLALLEEILEKVKTAKLNSPPPPNSNPNIPMSQTANSGTTINVGDVVRFDSGGNVASASLSSSTVPQTYHTPPKSQRRIYEEIEEFFRKLYSKHHWQKCTMVNVLVKESKEIKILPLISTMCQSIQNCANGADGMSTKISGVNARDIILQKEGRGLQTTFRASFSANVTSLSYEEMEHVFSRGLLDIPQAMKAVNNHYGHPYIYRKVSDYKMAETLYPDILEKYGHKQQEQHLVAIEENINDLPNEAFENQNNLDNPISALDI